MLGLVFTGGEGPSSRTVTEIIAKAGLTAAADSGLLLAERLGVEPDLIVGDMDSLADPAALGRHPQAEILTYPKEKDYTDTELAAAILRERGCTSLGILGGGGGRLDHLLGVYSMFHRNEAPAFWYTGSEEVLLVEGTFRLEGWKGREVSFLPVGAETARMTSRGLKWALDGLVWKTGDIGISNFVTEDTAEVTMKSGRLICVKFGGNGDS